MPGNTIRLLSLDGGGVRGLSSLMILDHLMRTIDSKCPPKPCDYFDMIGGTSTGGLIAIMLGRLRMSVTECITAYTALSGKVFEKKNHRFGWKLKIQGRFDSGKLEQAVKQILRSQGFGEDELLQDAPDAPCKVFVCATSKNAGSTVCLKSYRSHGTDDLESTTIWQACRATSAATSFFEPIAFGPYDEVFVEGALGANNPIYELWDQARGVWGATEPGENPEAQLQSKLTSLVSIGTGVPPLNRVGDSLKGIFATLQKLGTETEKTAENFRRDKSSLHKQGRYYRFNVNQGLQDIGLEESKKKAEIAEATRKYILSAEMLEFGPYRTSFTLEGVPVSGKFVARPLDTAELEHHLLPQQSVSEEDGRCKVFVLHGLGGMGKTQLAVDFARRHKPTFSSVFWLDGRSEERVIQSLAKCASRIPAGQIADRSRTRNISNLVDKEDIRAAAKETLNWLALEENRDWLLVFDNVDQDPSSEEAVATGAYDVRKYIPGDQGSVLITTRLEKLAQLGTAKELKKVDKDLSKSVFKKWARWTDERMAMDDNVEELLDLLDGLPLALAQAASYLGETRSDAASYVRRYNERFKELMQSDDESAPLMDYQQRSVWTTWTISFKAIETKNKDAANLLCLWAFSTTTAFGTVCYRRPAKKPKTAVPDGFAIWRATKADEAHEGDKGDTSDKGDEGMYSIHPVVHKWMSHRQDEAQKRAFAMLAVLVVGLSVPTKGSNRDKDFGVLRNQLLPHAERCSRWLAEVSGGEDDFPLLPIQAESVSRLGFLYGAHGRLEEAERITRLALDSKKKMFGPDHMATLSAMNELGLVYEKQGRLGEAERIFRQVQEGVEEVYGAGDTTSLNATTNLAVVYEKQGRLEEAEMMFRRVQEGLRKVVGPDHIIRLNLTNNLGALYKKQGRLGEAERMLQDAREGFDKVIGPDHIMNLSTVNNLGAVYEEQGRLREAEMMYRQAREGFEKALGRNHPVVSEIGSSLHRVHLLMGCEYCARVSVGEPRAT
ncbi:FabD/lysophospholipase-like protein [Sodiomyces alkalinus F11]|uniref:FabD/lysophospholipase-like protein n=1 Tax=Sodiomyces alkalinus (strain CBS 110278 / VKM F-3762 / F11) TaxID=1314773 RepID=A0A3N2PRK7_SODAK|nr:FabD/lysophospholipase-like protein [Sodiomyces alkalinus F11]ROT37152.1 FabD/lysophospholipase-like protein [Sodiomyces alkalinus F11]